MERMQNKIARIIEQSKKEHWDKPIPIVSAKIRLAVSSLAEQLPEFWNKPPSEVADLLNKNNGVREIFTTCSDETIAFAIRDRRM